MNASLSRGRPSNEGKIHQYVASIALVKGTPFYGFHIGWKLYCKIYLYSPRHITQLAKLLSNPVIMKRRFQPFEAHLGYLHQFMIDFNLYGCNYLDVETKNVKYRRVYQGDVDSDDEDNDREVREVPYGSKLRESHFPVQSFSGWEVDICAHDILNRHQVGERVLHQDFGERNKEEDQDSKLLNSLDELWKQHGSHMRGEGSFTASAPREIRTDWLQEHEYRGYIAKLMQDEKRTRGVVKAESIPFTVPAEDHIPTAFQAVEYLATFYQKRDVAGRVPVPEKPPQLVDYDVDVSAMMDMEKERDEDTENYFDSGDEDIFDDLDEEQREEEAKEEEFADKPEVLGEKEKIEMARENIQVVRRTAGVNGLPFGESRSETPKTPSRDIDIGGVPFDIEDFGTPDKDLKFSPIPKPVKHGIPTSSPVPATKRPRLEIQYPGNVHHGSQMGSFSDGLKTPKMQQAESPRLGTSPRSILRRPSAVSVKSPGMSTDGHSQPSLWQSGQTGSFSEPRSARQVRFSQTENTESDRKSSLDTRSIQTPETPTVSFSEFNSSQGNSASNASSQTDPSDPEYFERRYRRAFNIPPDTELLFFGEKPPSVEEAMESLADVGGVSYQDAFFSNPEDVPEVALDYGGVGYKPQARTVAALPEFDPMGEGKASPLAALAEDDKIRYWEYTELPPTYKEMEEWAKTNPWIEEKKEGRIQRSYSTQQLDNASQIDGPTQKNRYGFKYSQTKHKEKVKVIGDMTIMSLEIHVNTRGSLVPDPEKDAVECLFWCISFAGSGEEIDSGAVIVGYDYDQARLQRSCNVEVRLERSEVDLINALVDIVRHHDPDILCGYEVHSSSWGYVIGRAFSMMGMRLTEELSRVKQHGRGRVGKDVDKWGYNKAAAIKVTGRHFVNIWRAMRGELALTGYKMENVVFHLLNRR